MTTFAIGDIQGCHDELLQLLESIGFRPSLDRLLFCGDLVNRGPKSLQVLRFVRSLGEAAVTVLGNHDLHLLAVAHGGHPGRRDTLAEVLAAPDRDALLDWLAQRPLVHREPGKNLLLVHAGLAHGWTADQALSLGTELHEALISPKKRARFLKSMYGDKPSRWDPQLSGIRRLRFSVNCMTRMRFCKPDGSLELRDKGKPGDDPAGHLPWFAMPGRRSAGEMIVFGHWSTLGRVHWPEHRVWGLDTGCVWGGRLTALRLDDGRLFSVPGKAYGTID
jgi:bis(5'-nucleosyl)-tetraphosphatase (symmetrical)